MTESLEYARSLEIDFDPHAIAVVTTTFYPKWTSGEPTSDSMVDHVRGNLALRTIEAAKNQGFQVLVVDGGENPAFQEMLVRMDVEPRPEIEKGMSRSRQQAFREACALEGVRAICWTEPEKVAIAEACLPMAAIPVLKGEADLVIPSRDETAFSTYPKYQAEFEKLANHLWNALLRKHGLLSEEDPDLDAWFGPRIFTPKMADLFLRQYIFERGFVEGRGSMETTGMDPKKIIRPDLWPNATFIPIMAALHEGYRVRGLEVPYRHPPEQTAIETDSPEFERKRAVQLRGIYQVSSEYLKMLAQTRPSRLRLME